MSVLQNRWVQAGTAVLLPAALATGINTATPQPAQARVADVVCADSHIQRGDTYNVSGHWSVQGEFTFRCNPQPCVDQNNAAHQQVGNREKELLVWGERSGDVYTVDRVDEVGASACETPGSENGEPASTPSEPAETPTPDTGNKGGGFSRLDGFEQQEFMTAQVDEVTFNIKDLG